MAARVLLVASDPLALLLCALFVAAQDAQYQGRTFLKLVGTPEQSTAGMGAAVCVLDDIDGDGTRDFAVSRSSDGNVTGGVPSVVAVSGANGQSLWVVEADMFDILLGASLTRLDDLNGDKVGDLLVGTPTGIGDPTNTANFAWVLSGRDGKRLLEMRGNTVANPQGANDQFGIATAAAGDMDCDGLADFWISSTVARGEHGEWLGMGRVRAFSGGSGKELRRFDVPEGHVAGWVLAHLSDVNEDGVGDVATAGSWESAWLYVLSGADAKPIYEVPLAVGQITALTNAGDINSDGVEDLAVGAWVADVGTVLLLSGATGAELGVLEGPEPKAGFGYALAKLPDLDDDGVGELAIGMPYYGLGLGRVEIRSPTSRTVLFFQNGLRADGAFGAARDAADLDGDGTVELIVGQPGALRGMGSTQPSARTWHGAVQVISIEPSRR